MKNIMLLCAIVSFAGLSGMEKEQPYKRYRVEASLMNSQDDVIMDLPDYVIQDWHSPGAQSERDTAMITDWFFKVYVQMDKEHGIANLCSMKGEIEQNAHLLNKPLPKNLSCSSPTVGNAFLWVLSMSGNNNVDEFNWLLEKIVSNREQTNILLQSYAWSHKYLECILKTDCDPSGFNLEGMPAFNLYYNKEQREHFLHMKCKREEIIKNRKRIAQLQYEYDQASIARVMDRWKRVPVEMTCEFLQALKRK
jgi:hypothetical protein